MYYGLAAPFVSSVSAGSPARGLNLFSAVAAAAAVGLLTWTAAAVTGTILSGVAAALLLAFSYTFWTQAVIAEVYTLHLALVGLVLIALHAFASKPTHARLAAFCAAYALGFGNHLSMILLFLPCTAFILIAHPRPRELLRPRVIGTAALIAAAGALLYTPNLAAILSSIDAPVRWSDRLPAFWFDVTKADWRESMVLGVQATDTGNRLAMWGWDTQQQFGRVGLILTVAGAVRLWWISRAWATLVWLAYGINTLFAVTYNVGDSHVFFLPGHFFAAFAAGAAVTVPLRFKTTGPSPRLGRITLFHALAAGAILYAGWRAWDTWPAANRHRDTRGSELAARVTFGLTGQSALLVSQMNWEQENALLYAGRYRIPRARVGTSLRGAPPLS